LMAPALFLKNNSPSGAGRSCAPARRCGGHRPAPVNRRRAGLYREMPILLWRATLRASALAVSDLIDISAQFHSWWNRCPMRASRRSSDRDCKLIGPNPFFTPFNVFWPLTLCLTFGVHSINLLSYFFLPQLVPAPTENAPDCQ